MDGSGPAMGCVKRAQKGEAEVSGAWCGGCRDRGRMRVVRASVFRSRRLLVRNLRVMPGLRRPALPMSHYSPHQTGDRPRFCASAEKGSPPSALFHFSTPPDSPTTRRQRYNFCPLCKTSSLLLFLPFTLLTTPRQIKYRHHDHFQGM